MYIYRRGEVSVGLVDWSAAEKQHVGEELSDIFLYLIRLSERCHVDLSCAIQRKIQLNQLKYPVQLVKGKSKKYNEYQEHQLNHHSNNDNHSLSSSSSSSSNST